MEHRFSARLEWSGGALGAAREYRTYSRAYVAYVEGKPPVAGSADRAFLGDAAMHNPEDLLVIALSACHLLSYLAECTRRGVTVVSYEDHASGTMRPLGGRMRFAEVVLHPNVVVEGDVDLAHRLHDNAHASCFIANSVNFPVRHEATVTTRGPT